MTSYDQIVYEVARQEGFTDIVAKMMAAQSRVETSLNGVDYNTNNFRCNNNMFGMKYVGQALATRGTLAPSSEISNGCSPTGSDCNRKGVGNCKDGDYYARYASPEDSARDAIQRLFKKTVNGITPEQINQATDSTSYATVLKKRSYYGFKQYGESGAQQEINDYAAAIRARLKRVSVTEWIADVYQNNKTTINFGLIAGILIGLSGYMYVLYKKGIILKK
jgi:hypothetical protein